MKFLTVPVLCHDNVMQPRKGSWARGARARGRVFGCVSARPPMPAMPHDRSGSSLGKSKIGDFENLVVRFGPPSPFLALSCAELAHERHLQIFTEYIPNNCFSSPRQAENGSGGHMVLQGSSPDGPWRHNLHCATVDLENHQKSLKFTKK